MGANRPFVLSIAGFDPSAGAGILADIKTFEQHKVYGLGISTAQTLQTENKFISVKWETEQDILEGIEMMLSNYPIWTIKIGIIEDLKVLNTIVSFINQKNIDIKIVLDTIIRSSTGFDFWEKEINMALLLKILPNVFLITPNYEEVLKLFPSSDAKTSAEKLAGYCNVLVKGGHNSRETGVDYLYTKKHVEKIEADKNHVFNKHGSGCVLSAAIAANLALGLELHESCVKAKRYTEHYLSSNYSLLGYHHV